MTEPITQSLRDEITLRVERLTSAVWPVKGKADSKAVSTAMSDLLEFVLSRATGMASQTVIKFDGRLGELEATAESLGKRVDKNSTRLNEVNRRIDRKAEQIDDQEVRLGNLERMVGERPES